MPCFRELGVPAFACLQMISFHRQKLDEERRLQIVAGRYVNGSRPRNRAARPPWPVECRVGRTPLFLAAELVQPLLQFIELPLEIFHLTAAALRFAL